MGLRKAGGGCTLAFLLNLWLNLLAEEEHDFVFNDSMSLEAALAEPIVRLVDSGENLTEPKEVEFGECTVTCELETRRLRKPSTDIVLVFVLITGVIVCVGVIFAITFIILNWAAVKSFWQTKVWKNKDDLGSVRTSIGPATTVEASQMSQAETSAQEQGSYQEWNAAGGGEEAEGEGDKGNY